MTMAYEMIDNWKTLYLKENMCGEGGGKVCCQPLSTNLRIDFSPAEVNLENFVTEDEDLEIEKLFRLGKTSIEDSFMSKNRLG